MIPGATINPIIRIRYAIAMDFPAIEQIEHDSYDEPMTVDCISAFYKLPDMVTIVATDSRWSSEDPYGDIVVGYAMYRVGSNTTTLARVGVDRAWRRRGVGRCMVQNILSKLNHKLRRFRATLEDTETARHCLLRSCGIRAKCVQRCNDGPDVYVFEFVKPK